MTLLWRAHRFTAVALPLVTLVVAPLPALSLYFLKKVVDGVSLWLQGDVAGGRSLILFYLGLSFGVMIAQGILDQLSGILQDVMQKRLTQHIQKAILRQAVTLDIAFFETPSFYDQLQRAQREASFRPFTILSTMLIGARQAFTLVGLLAVLASLAWWVVPALVLTTVPGLMIQSRFGRLGWAIATGRTSEERRMLYYQGLLTSNREAKEVRLLGLGEHLISRWQDLYWRFYRQDLRLSLRKRLSELGVVTAQTLTSLGLYAFTVYRTITDPVVTIGSLVMYQQAMNRSVRSMEATLNSLASLYENNLYISQLFEFLSLRPRLRVSATPISLPVPIRRGIRFEAVTFRYPGATQDAIRDASLEIRPAEKVAFVGENGAGKTTLVKLLARLYDPQSGRILVDGVDLRDLDLAEWRRHIGILFQDYVQYSATVRENIGFGRLEYMSDIGRIQAAADLAGATGFIETLEGQWDSMLGRLFGGKELSIGEWQRIAVARTFLRDAQLLILDEPTAALDAMQEWELFSRFSELSQGKTTVLISHRFSTVRMVDRIFVIEQGGVLESGSHEELLELDNRYAEFFHRQAAPYH